MLFPLTGNSPLRNFPSAVFAGSRSGLFNLACEDLDMKRRGSNPEREFRGSAHRRSEEWNEDPIGRMYDDEAEDDVLEDEEEEFEDEEENLDDEEEEYAEEEEEETDEEDEDY
jgi:hypothetical protein